MAKKFFEVFGELKLNEDLISLLQEVTVEKISTNSARDFLRVWILSPRLIQKKNIYLLEEELKKQIFKNLKLNLNIIEKYELSRQYHAEYLYRDYRESMLLELRKKNALLYNVLETARVSFEDESTMHLSLQKTLVSDRIYYWNHGIGFYEQSVLWSENGGII